MSLFTKDHTSPCFNAVANLITFLLLAPGTIMAAPEPPTPEAQPASKPANPQTPLESPQEAVTSPPADSQAQRDENFKKLVTNVRLVGNFTLDGDTDPGKLRREEYAITGAMKLGNGDSWALTSRIKYGDVDLTVPVPVQVKWAGNTPVITVDSVKIPGLGTFSARVLLDKTRYAGTWSHDENGGHLFGVIERGETDGK